MYLNKKKNPVKLLQLPFFCLAFSPKRRRLLTISNLFFNRWGFLYQFTHGRWVQSNLGGL